MSQVDKNKMYVPPPHPHTIHLWATHFNRYWHVLFLALAQWAAGRGYWKSGAAHTLDIYKTTNHWNHRNVLFHFYWQTSCHADHKAVTQPSSPHCITSSFPSLSLSHPHLTRSVFFFSFSFFLMLFCVLFSGFHTSTSFPLSHVSVLHESHVRLTDSQVFEISTSAFKTPV